MTVDEFRATVGPDNLTAMVAVMRKDAELTEELAETIPELFFAMERTLPDEEQHYPDHVIDQANNMAAILKRMCMVARETANYIERRFKLKEESPNE